MSPLVIKRSCLKRVLFLIAIFLSYSIFLTYFSEFSNHGIQAQEGKVHPEDWIKKHGGEFVQNKSFCKACHAQDLSGGFTNFKCDLCHLMPDHPDDWIKIHGKKFAENNSACTICHAKDLSGGVTGFKCDLCHLMPKHPKDWKGTHGPQYLANKKQCTLCHGTNPFDGTKTPYSMNCTRCHSINTAIPKWQAESHTSQFYFNIHQNAQIREDRFENREFETNTYAGFHITENSRQIISSVQMGFTREWVGNDNNFNLFEAYVEVDNLLKNHLDITIGRQGFGAQIDYFLMDGINLYFKPHKYFDISVYAGIPRYIEEGDFEGEIGLIAGFSWILNEINYTNARVDFLYQKKNFSNNNLNNTDKMYIGASFSKGISIFKIYGLGEYDLTDTLPIALTFGTEIYPFVKKVSFVIEGSYFNESRNDNLGSVFTIFSEGALWQARAGVSIDIVKNLNIHDYFSFQRYEVLDGLHKNGFNNELGLRYYFEKIRLDSALTYYFYRSYGGTLHGVNLDLYEKWSRRFYTRLFVDFMTYTKITNNDDTGLNLLLEAGINIIPGLTFSAAAEYARNDVFRNDLRGTFILDYTFNTKYLDARHAPPKSKKK